MSNKFREAFKVCAEKLNSNWYALCVPKMSYAHTHTRSHLWAMASTIILGPFIGTGKFVYFPG